MVWQLNKKLLINTCMLSFPFGNSEESDKRFISALMSFSLPEVYIENGKILFRKVFKSVSVYHRKNLKVMIYFYYYLEYKVTLLNTI